MLLSKTCYQERSCSILRVAKLVADGFTANDALLKARCRLEIVCVLLRIRGVRKVRIMRVFGRPSTSHFVGLLPSSAHFVCRIRTARSQPHGFWMKVIAALMFDLFSSKQEAGSLNQHTVFTLLSIVPDL